MQFTWRNNTQESYGVKKFLTRYGVSHRMYNDVKRHGHIWINGQITSLDDQVNPQDQVTVEFPRETGDDNVAISNQPIQVVFEDDNWLVVDKPAGLTSVPGPSNRVDTLVNRIKGYFQKHGSADLRPHLITRLDRFTSGLVLVAKNRLANSLANQAVSQHTIEKEYYALASGNFKQSHALIDLPIGRPGEAFRRVVMDDGQNAKTEYWVVQQFKDYAWLKLKLHTGRTHQIRVHMTALEHPLLGDQLYEGPLDEGIQRQALHAYYLKFYDPLSDSSHEFKLELPEDMQEVIKEEEHDR